MNDLSEKDYEIVKILEKALPQKVSLGSIYVMIHRRHERIRFNLSKLVSRNFITKTKDKEYTYYTISKRNRRVKPRMVKCPKCGTKRIIYLRNHVVAHCKNPECVTPAGKRTKYFLMSRKTIYDESKLLYLAD